MKFMQRLDAKIGQLLYTSVSYNEWHDFTTPNGDIVQGFSVRLPGVAGRRHGLARARLNPKKLVMRISLLL